MPTHVEGGGPVIVNGVHYEGSVGTTTIYYPSCNFNNRYGFAILIISIVGLSLLTVGGISLSKKIFSLKVSHILLIAGGASMSVALGLMFFSGGCVVKKQVSGGNSSGRSKGVYGSGKVIKKELAIPSALDRIVFSGIGKLTVKQGSAAKLLIHAEDNIQECLSQSVSGQTLQLGSKQGTQFQTTQSIQYELTLPSASLKQVKLSGTGKAYIDFITNDQFQCTVSGTGSIYVRGGQLSAQDVTISGTGSYHAKDLISQRATVKVTGTGSAEVRVQQHANVSLRGAGSCKLFAPDSATVTLRRSGASTMTRVLI